MRAATTNTSLRVLLGQKDQVPTIEITSDPDAIRIIRQNILDRTFGEFYCKDGNVVALETVSGRSSAAAGDEDATAPVDITVVRPALLAAMLSEKAYVVRHMGRDRTEEETRPSNSILDSVLAPQEWPTLPVLHKIVTTPVLRADGTLLQEPGYDPASGFYLARRAGHLEHVPTNPTAEQVQQAKDFLLNVFLRDFPWRGPADKANYVALMASPILRPFLRCPMPFAIVDATMPGSGKTILTSCIGLLVGQRVLTWADSDEEMRKSITTVLGDQCGVVVWDNLIEGSVIQSAVLARLVTEKVWTDRRLGTNQASSYENDRLWCATGNNLHTGADMASRTVWVRLDPDCPAPEARTGFSIPHLDNWIMQPENQAKVLHHLLVLVADWTAHGAPSDHGAPAMRQFSTWAQRLGGFLAHHEISGFLANLASSKEELDDDAAEWRAFLMKWHSRFGDTCMSAQDLRQSAEPLGDGMPDPWAGTFPTTDSGKLLTPKALGRLLTGQVGRWRVDFVVRSGRDRATNARYYRVEHRPIEPRLKTNPETRKPGKDLVNT